MRQDEQAVRMHREVDVATRSYVARSDALYLWLAYLAFVVYGSLVPLGFRPLPLAEAWSIFQQVPFYQLGIESRADWVANGVLYVPLGFLSAHLCLQMSDGRHSAPVFFLAGIFCTAVAVGVEFAQIFFPPRTVSLNDLLAECVGSLLGLSLAARYSAWFKTLLHALFAKHGALVRHLTEAYLFAYLALSLFPFDFLLSGSELEQKLAGNGWGWLLVDDAKGWLHALLKLGAEVLLTVPYGLYLASRHGQGSPLRFLSLQVLVAGIVLGLLIETLQFFTASGVSQGLSVITRLAGVVAGVALWRQHGDWSPARVAKLIRRHALMLCVCYIPLLFLANGWLAASWRGSGHAWESFANLRFLPFYYHYYTSEAKALMSLGSVMLMYVPVGVLFWAGGHSAARAALVAAAAAVVMESGKLFIADTHPDPTNVILAAVAAWTTLQLASTFTKAIAGATTVGPVSLATSTRAELPASRPVEPARQVRLPRYVLVFTVLAFVAQQVAGFPVAQLVLAALFTVCALVVWRRPETLVFILPTALPVLDLAPWSGRFFLDEFDLLVMLCLALAWIRCPPAQGAKWRTGVFALSLFLLALSYAIAVLRGLLPWQQHDANAFASYFSHFNALRIGKGVLWALLTLLVLRRLALPTTRVVDLLAKGMACGLGLTVAFIFWERNAFASLLDFGADYRSTGPISAMHTGGAYIEAFLVTALPFLLLLVVRTHSSLSRLLGAALLVAATYALMITYSRGGYAAFAVSLSLLLFFIWRDKAGSPRGRAVVLAIGASMLAVVLPVLTGDFAQKRLSSVDGDLAIRSAHWRDSLDLRPSGWAGKLFGIGLGRFPEAHHLFSGEDGRSGTYRFMREGDNLYLRMNSGDAIYFEQTVAVRPKVSYTLALAFRSGPGGEAPRVSICEKSLLRSFNCVLPVLAESGSSGDWRLLQGAFSGGRLGEQPWYARRQIKMSLASPAPGRSAVDIDDVRLVDGQGNELVENGDFSAGSDRWFFSADNHLQWHAKSLPYAVLIEQGWFGAFALAFLVLLALKRAATRAWRGNIDLAATLAALCAFLIVGLFDTLIDSPRFLFLLLALVLLCAAAGGRRSPAE